MMKKRIFSFAMAAIMTLSMGTVAFADTDTDIEYWKSVSLDKNNPGTGWDTDKDDKGATVYTYTGAPLEGTGTIKYVDTEIYSIILPTENALDFTLDPQGLLSVDDSEEPIKLGELQGGGVLGVIDYVPLINNSAVPVKLGVYAEATTTAGNNSINWLADTDAIDTDTDTEDVLLYLAFANTDVQDTDITFSSELAFVLDTDTDTDAFDLSFAMPAADYYISKHNGDTDTDAGPGGKIVIDGDYKISLDPGTGHGTAFQVGGYMNPKANWSEYSGDSATKTIGLTMTFSFKKDTKKKYVASDYYEGAGRVLGKQAEWLLAGTDAPTLTPDNPIARPTPPPRPVDPAITSTNLTIVPGTNLRVQFSLGTLSKEFVATSIKSVTIKRIATPTVDFKTLATSEYTNNLASGNIELKAGMTVYLGTWPAGAYDLTIVFADASNQELTLSTTFTK